MGAELSALAQHIAGRVGRILERQGLLERDAENASLAELALDDEPMEALLAHSITYRIAGVACPGFFEPVIPGRPPTTSKAVHPAYTLRCTHGGGACRRR